MPATEPLSGQTYPVVGDAFSISADIKKIWHAQSGQSIPRFATATARDTAYTNWAAAGYTVADGMLAYTADADTLWIRDGGSWRFLAYKGAVANTGTPQTHIKKLPAQNVPVNASTQISGWTVDRSDANTSVNTSTGVVTFNTRGVWTINGRHWSDVTPAVDGFSAVSMNWSSAAYPVENTMQRSSGYSSAGSLRQQLNWTGYLEAGTTWATAAFHNNTGGTTIPYNVNFTFALIG